MSLLSLIVAPLHDLSPNIPLLKPVLKAILTPAKPVTHRDRVNTEHTIDIHFIH